jgi:hypothetical protein
MPRFVLIILMYHRHKPMDNINLLRSDGDVICFLWDEDKATVLSPELTQCPGA